MTSTPPDPTPPPAPRRFLRSADDRVLGGVAGGLGAAFGVDAIIFRIALGALVFAGGIGLLVYGAALLLVAADDGTGSPAPREGTWRRASVVGGGLLLVGAAVAILGGGGLWDGGTLFLLALLVAVGYAALRARGERSPLGERRDARGLAKRLALLAVVGTLVCVGGGLTFFGAAWATAAGGGVAVAGVVLALGAVLVVAAARGERRARWLAVPAIVIAFPAAVVSAADVSLDGGVGERSYRPTGTDVLPAGYRLGAGELVVDLRGLDWSGGRRAALGVDVGVGHAVVYVPEDVCVSATNALGAGYADVLGVDAGGVDVEHDVRRSPAAGVPELALRTTVGMGAVEVRHRGVAGRPGPRGSRFSEDDEDGASAATRAQARRIADRACAGTR